MALRVYFWRWAGSKSHNMVNPPLSAIKYSQGRTAGRAAARGCQRGRLRSGIYPQTRRNCSSAPCALALACAPHTALSRLRTAHGTPAWPRARIHARAVIQDTAHPRSARSTTVSRRSVCVAPVTKVQACLIITCGVSCADKTCYRAAMRSTPSLAPSCTPSLLPFPPPPPRTRILITLNS